MPVERFSVLNRFSGTVQFTAEIECKPDAPAPIKLGLAIKWGLKAGANMAGADMAGANMAGANMAGAKIKLTPHGWPWGQQRAKITLSNPTP